MIKNKNRGNRSLFENENKNSTSAFWKNFFAVNGILSFDFFQYSIIYREKLQIIYANIRV